MTGIEKEQALAEELFRARGAARRAGRAYQRGRKMTRSNLGERMKARASRPADVIQAWLDKLRNHKPKYNVIPANLRPHVPHNRAILARGDWQQLSEYARDLRMVCTERQWQVIEKQYFGRMTG